MAFRSRFTLSIVAGIFFGMLYAMPGQAAPPLTADGLDGNLVLNPSFEDQQIGVNTQQLGVLDWIGSRDFTSNGEPDPLVQPNSGTQSAEVDVNMSQTINGTTAGELVDISYFAENANLKASFPTVTFGGAPLVGGIESPSPTDPANYDEFSFTDVVVPVNNSVLLFTNPDAFDFAMIDDVTVAPAVAGAPELTPTGSAPAVAFTLLGLCCLIDRRRQA